MEPVKSLDKQWCCTRSAGAMRNSTLIVTCAFFSVTVSAHAELASFDVNGAGGPTQAGFEGLFDPGGSATQNGITMTMNISGPILERNRGIVGNVALSPWPDVSRDYFAAEGGGSTTVDLSGLEADTSYLFRWHHFEAAHNEVYASVKVYLDEVLDPANLLFESFFGNQTTNFFTEFTAKTSETGTLRVLTGNSIGYLNGFEVVSISTSMVPGDFDGDGDVDGADFVAWQTHFPAPSGATLADGDADGDGDVDGADFVVWQTNFPFTPGGSATPTPEPHAFVLAAIGGLLLKRVMRPLLARLESLKRCSRVLATQPILATANGEL